MGIFKKEEDEIKIKFEHEFKKELEVYNELLTVYENFIRATSGKIKTNDFPDWNILLLLSQVLILMNNAIDSLEKGYLRQSEIFIRISAEAIILSCYFKEFPETEKEYRTINYRDFFYKHKIDKMLKRVETEGKLFIYDKDKAKNISWNKVVFKNLFEESSKYLHNNPEIIYSLTVNNIDPNSDTLVLGPQKYNFNVLSMELRRLFNTMLTSIVVLGISLRIKPNDTELLILKKSQKITKRLNK